MSELEKGFRETGLGIIAPIDLNPGDVLSVELKENTWKLIAIEREGQVIWKAT